MINIKNYYKKHNTSKNRQPGLCNTKTHTQTRQVHHYINIQKCESHKQNHCQKDTHHKKQENQKGKNTNIHCKAFKQKRKKTEKQENNI